MLISLVDDFQLGFLQQTRTPEETRLFTPTAKQAIKPEINDQEQARLTGGGSCKFKAWTQRTVNVSGFKNEESLGFHWKYSITVAPN